ncbi:MAG: acyl-CoA dehydrogenase family protein [Micromonosporaceae bacterium]
MRFAFTEEQRAFGRAVADVLARSCPPEVVRQARADPGVRAGPVWRSVADLGLIGLMVPEEHGGIGGDEILAVTAYEQTGRAALPCPIVETAAVAPVLLTALPDVAQAWLPRIAAGEAVVAVRSPLSPYVLDADVADLLLICEDGTVRATPPGLVELTPQPAVDPARRLFTVKAHDAKRLPRAASPAATAVIGRAVLVGAVLTAAQLLGAGRRLLDDAVAYAGKRRQFGEPVGSFQAVKHRLADALMALEFAAPLVHRAAWTLARWRGAPGEPLTARRDASAAKVAAGEAAGRAARAALQVHGAIGYTSELDLQLWLTRVWSLRAAWGDEAYHRSVLRTALLDGDAPPRPERVP